MAIAKSGKPGRTGKTLWRNGTLRLASVFAILLVIALAALAAPQDREHDRDQAREQDRDHDRDHQ